jgi:hypothetical protein
MHVPFGRQHAPVGTGCGHSVFAHAVPFPRYVPPRSSHRAAVSTTHSTPPFGVGTQHAPVGTGAGHDTFVQTVPFPRYVPFAATHSASVRVTHCRSVVPGTGTQHAPRGVGCGHAVFVHADPFPRYVPPSETHCASVRTTQITPLAFVGMQHAPVGVGAGHDVFVHTVPFPRYVPPAAAHSASVRVTHCRSTVPGTGTQHAPRGVGCGHGLLWHVVPFPRYTPPSRTHTVSVVTTHDTPPLAFGKQHAPVLSVGCAVACTPANPSTDTAEHTAKTRRKIDLNTGGPFSCSPQRGRVRLLPKPGDAHHATGTPRGRDDRPKGHRNPTGEPRLRFGSLTDKPALCKSQPAPLP